MGMKPHLRETRDGLLEEVSQVLDQHLPGVETALHETGGDETQKIALSLTFKTVGKEDEAELVCEVQGKSTIAAAKTSKKITVSGGQLKLF